MPKKLMNNALLILSSFAGSTVNFIARCKLFKAFMIKIFQKIGVSCCKFMPIAVPITWLNISYDKRKL